MSRRNLVRRLEPAGHAESRRTDICTRQLTPESNTSIAIAFLPCATLLSPSGRHSYEKTRQIIRTDTVTSRILTIRGQKVILDSDLAGIYGVTAKRLNEQVKRNALRFPPDFVFQLTKEEHGFLRSQIATLKSGSGRHRKFLPSAFTENGAVMAANVLNSPQAVRMSVFVVRAFVRMRELLSAGSKELALELKQLEAKLTSRLDIHETAIVDVLRRIMELLDPPPAPAVPEKSMGFHTLLKVPEKKSVAHTGKRQTAGDKQNKASAMKL